MGAQLRARGAAAGPGPGLCALRNFAADETLLTEVLREVIAGSEGPSALGLLDETVALGRAARLGDEGAADRLAELVRGLDLHAIEVLVRALTRWFQLVNLAEDNERVRRLRAGDKRSPGRPRAGSIREAVAGLAAQGTSARELARALERAELRLVMTAHPTEARRRTTIDKLARVFAVLRELDQMSTADPQDARRRLLATVQELWGSDDLRAISIAVADEVRGGLIHFASTLADTVPRVYRDLEQALAESYPDHRFDVPPVLSFGSWIGGDRDGNPFVTPATTLEALALMREQCLRLIAQRLEMLAGRLSLSERITGRAPGLRPVLEAGAADFPELAEQLAAINPEEPYRRALSFIRERVRATQARTAPGYAEPGELVVDLKIVQTALTAGSGALTAAGDLRDTIRQVEVFGFHYARLDVREHARVHRAVLDEIFNSLGICARYAGMSEENRVSLLVRHISDRRPLIPSDVAGFSTSAQETVATFRMLRETLSGPRRVPGHLADHRLELGPPRVLPGMPPRPRPRTGRRDLASAAGLASGQALGGRGNRRPAGDPVGVLLDAGAHRTPGLARPRYGADQGPGAPRPRVRARDDHGVAVLHHPAGQCRDGLLEGRPGDRRALRPAVGGRAGA